MKAALAMALAHDTKLLILDEATAGMDVSGREEVIEMLEDYISEGNGILISSHISTTLKTASKCICINKLTGLFNFNSIKIFCSNQIWL